MKPKESAWDIFLETGKIDDYLSYCNTRKQEMYTMATTKGADAAHAIDNDRNHSPGLQN